MPALKILVRWLLVVKYRKLLRLLKYHALKHHAGQTLQPQQGFFFSLLAKTFYYHASFVPIQQVYLLSQLNHSPNLSRPEYKRGSDKVLLQNEGAANAVRFACSILVRHHRDSCRHTNSCTTAGRHCYYRTRIDNRQNLLAVTVTRSEFSVCGRD